MPVPLPADSAADLTPPDRDEALLVHRGILAAAEPLGGPTSLQRILAASITRSLTGFDALDTAPPPIGATEFAELLRARNSAFRTRVLQMMLLTALVLHPMPPEVGARLRAFADELEVHDDLIDVAEAYASGSLDLAAADFARNGYLASVDPARIKALHATALAQAWETSTDDPQLAGLWSSLEELTPDTLGRGVADFYRDRGFVYPGLVGSAPPTLAQHDWVHVLAGYGTTLEGELEVFGFIARANDDPRGFSLLAMVVSLFETGDLASGAGLFEADPGHLSTAGAAQRLADSMRRAALMPGSTDFLAYDWFAVADRPLAVVRHELGLPAKSASAITAGSAGPWEVGGITPNQLAAAAKHAQATGVEYAPWRPDPER